MDPIKVNVVGFQSFETRFHRLHHILALVACSVWVCARKSVGVFRGKHHALAMAVHKVAEERFARPVRVVVGWVAEIAPSPWEGSVSFPCPVLGSTPTQ